MARLALVEPRTPNDLDANLRIILGYLCDAVSKNFLDLGSSWHDLIQTDLAEIWYWFDDHNLIHRIVIIGDEREADLGDEPADMHHTFPALLFVSLHDVEAIPKDSISRWEFLTQLDRQGKIPDSQEAQSALRNSMDLVERASLNWPVEEPSDESPHIGEDLESLLMLVTWFNRIRAVPVSKAAQILKVSEKTVRNLIAKGKLTPILRNGVTWVVLSSLLAYLRSRYQNLNPDLWDQMQRELRKQGKLGKPDKQ